MYGAPNYMPQVPDSNLTFQQRVPQYGHYYSPPMVSGAAQIQQPAEQQIICRPVASIEEARAIPTDFSGALMILPDLSHGMVYTKQLNFADGSAMFRQFKAVVDEAPRAQVEYAPASELEALRGDFATLRGDFEQLAATLPQEKPKINRGGAEK